MQQGEKKRSGLFGSSGKDTQINNLSSQGFFRDIIVLENEISEKEKDQREAEKALWRATLEWRNVASKAQSASDVESGVAWKIASGARASKAAGVGWKGTWRGRRPKFRTQCGRFAKTEEESCDAERIR